MCMLIHVYPHKPLMKIILAICSHQADCPSGIFYLMCDLWLWGWGMVGVVHDTEFLTEIWHVYTTSMYNQLTIMHYISESIDLMIFVWCFRYLINHRSVHQLRCSSRDPNRQGTKTLDTARCSSTLCSRLLNIILYPCPCKRQFHW